MGRAQAKWVRCYDGLAPGVVMCHETMVAGWHLRAELVLHGVGALQIKVNDQIVGQPLLECTLAKGRRHYQAVLKRLGKPRQARLPI